MVLVRETAAGGQLIGYYTGTDSTETEDTQSARLKTVLAAELPEYMVPAQLMRWMKCP